MLIKNLFRYWTYQVFSPGTVLREKYEAFKTLLEYDKAAHEHMATLEEMYYNSQKYDFNAVCENYASFSQSVLGMVEALLKMCPSDYWALKDYFKKFDFYVRFMLAAPAVDFAPPFVLPFETAVLFDEAVAGKKASVLSELKYKLHLPVPPGFVITTNAFHYFIEFNDLRNTINNKLALLDIYDPASLEKTSREIESLILEAKVPQTIEDAVMDALVNFLGESSDIRFAVRSSAVKEDGEVSFAGQYLSVLNVKKSDIMENYKRVVAGKYSSGALFYRISHGILDDETPMAALVLEMIDSKAAGVMYTETPGVRKGDKKDITIHSIWGQGEALVSGDASPDVIRVSANDFSDFDIRAGGDKKQSGVSLDEASISTLARWGGKSIEDYFNCPQDIEWAMDKNGRLFILQSRPLNMSPQLPDKMETQRGINSKTVLCSGGDTICSGIGAGKVFCLENDSQLAKIPKGSVAVVRTAHPQFVTMINDISAIVIKTGSAASHFASIAREFGVPAFVNVQDGFEHLIEGQTVTVDAGQCVVYEGEHAFESVEDKPDHLFFRDSSFRTKLRYVINFCAKLKLTDPASKEFAPEGCRSLHDIVRFAHETAVKEMFLMGSRKGSRKKGARKLVSSIPMLFYVLDVGRGVTATIEEKNVLKPENIRSFPLKYTLNGLSDPGICWDETTHFDWEEYDRIVMAGGIISADSPQFGSYAVVSQEYMNVNFRFGYHFVILDSICTRVKEDNYILFRFSGGGGDQAGKSLRVNFIKKVLTLLGFWVQVKSDLVDAELKEISMERAESTLFVIGRLLGATKLMDMYLSDTQDIDSMAQEFMDGRSDFRNVTEEEIKNEK